MNYTDKYKNLEDQINGVISSITDKLDKENTIYELMYKDGVIGKLSVYAIEASYIGGKSPLLTITDGSGCKMIAGMDFINKAKLADIILEDRRVRVEEDFGTITPQDMNNVYGGQWFDANSVKGKMIDNAHCNEASIEEKIIILRGCGISIPYDPTEVIVKYHTVTFPDSVKDCISVIIV